MSVTQGHPVSTLGPLVSDPGGCPRGRPRQWHRRLAAGDQNRGGAHGRGPGFAYRAPFRARDPAFERAFDGESNGGGGVGGDGRNRRRRRGVAAAVARWRRRRRYGASLCAWFGSLERAEQAASICGGGLGWDGPERRRRQERRRPVHGHEGERRLRALAWACASAFDSWEQQEQDDANGAPNA